MTAIVTGVHVFPCSFQQQRFWVLDQINPGAAVYTMPAAYKLRGALDPAALEAALDRVVDRHESLRTVFRLEGEAPVQVVRAHERMVLPVTDLRARPTAEREEAAAAAYQEMVNRPFDLAKGPLLRASLFRLEESEWILAIVVHHIAADGVSMGLLFAELERCYIALARGETPDLPALPLQYPDFAVWQRKQAESSRMQRQLAWWRERLAGPLPILDLPADRPRPALQSFRGARRSVAIPVPLAEAIRELGRREGATPFMTFLAVFQVLLHRHAAQDDVIVGVITSGRQRHELEPLIGLFLNTLAIRTDLAGEPTFRELLGRVRDASLGALENQDVPFDRVAEAVAPAADRSRSPIFQAGFQLLDGMGTDFALPGLAVEPFRSAKDSAPFDLTLFLFGGDTSGGLRATLDFNTDLFDADTADRLLARYVTLLESIATDPGCPVSRLPLLPDAERRRLLVEWNDTAAEYPRAATFSELFRRVVAEHPDRVAVEAGTARISFAELDCRADRLAAWLESQRIGPGALVGVCLQRGPQLVPALLAILRTGAAYVPIDPAYPAERIAWMLEDSRAALVLTEPALATMLPHSGATAVVLDESAWPRGAGTGAPAARQTERATPDGLAYVIYTSGSTGRPKGAMIHHRGLVNYLWWAVRAYDAAAGEGAPVHSSIAFDLTITGPFSAPVAAAARLPKAE